MNSTTCPDQESLRQLLLGKMSGPPAEQLEEHLLRCDDCSAAADAISASDELTAAIQSPDIVQGDEELLPEAIERAKQLRSQAETVETDETLIVKSLPQAENAADSSDIPILDEHIDFLAPAEQPDEIGRLGEYRVLEVLGVGGMGVVFRAEDPKLERQIALKAMKPVVAASRSAKDRFLREAKATAAIEHDNIVHIYQVGEDRSVPFIAMQFLRGESLETRLKRERRLDQREVLRIGREVAAGLEAAHQRGLIHRDIKPDNIWLEGGTGRVKIVDFGLVRTATDDAGLTQSGMVLGTPRYMAPEQAQGQAVDRRCDLFSLGSVLYHLATGKAPFEGSNVTATLIAVVQKDPRPAEQVCPEIEPELSRLIMRLLSKARDQRPQSATEVSQVLAEIEQKLAADEADQARQRQVAETIALSKSPVPKPEPKPQPKSRIPIFFGGAVVTIALLVLAGPYFADVIFKYETKDGTLIVKVSGDDFATSVQGQQVMIRNTATNETFTIDLASPEEKHPLKPGSYQFLLTTDSGLTAQLEHFTIRSGRDEVVEVRWEPKAAQVASHDSVSPGTGWHGWPADAPPPAIAPFDAERARKHQEEWARYLGGPMEYTNSIAMKFVLIPPGEFTMGSTAEEIEAALKVSADDKHWQERINSEAPRHKVILTQPIYLCVNEVTQAEYEMVMGVNPSYFGPMGMGKEVVAGTETTDHPVEMVNSNDAAEFCAKLSQQEKLKPFYFRAGETITPLDGTGYRLPSEAEWEFGCRAGTTTKYWLGDHDEDLVRAGWFGANSGGRTHAAGELESNPFGLYDIHGNVWEWVQDWWEPTYYSKFTEKPSIDPNGSSSAGSRRVVRGGVWSDAASVCRSSVRSADDPVRRSHDIGFRVSLPVDAVKAAIAKHTQMAEAALDSYKWPKKQPDPAIAPLNAEQATKHQEEPAMPNTSGNLSQADRMNQPKLAKFVRGKWQIDGDVIEQTETSRGAMLLFGSPDFGEGDFTCEALRVDGDHGMAIVARATDDENYYYFDVGVFNIATTSYHHVVAKEADGDWRVLGFKKDGPNPADRWMKLRLRLRGDSIESYLDDQLVVSTKDDRRLQGYLGLRTWNAAGKYRNLKFTDINGKVLWQGLPEIPEQKSGLAIPANFTDSLGIAAAPDRRAAEWVLSVGGKVKVNDQDEFADSSSLPTVPFRLSYVGLGDNVQVTDADMAIFKDCEHLAALGLENTKVSDAGLIQFRDLRTLTHLYLQGSAVTDRGLTYFKDCSNLLSLGLGETHISDEALKIIGGLNKLQVVDLTKTQVTEQGIEELQRKLPNCKIIWDGGVIAPQETASLPGDKASSVSCDYGTLATGHWTPVLTRPAETVESRNAMLRDGVIEIQNGHAYDKSITAANVIVRAQVQKLNGQTVLITLRDVLGVYCSAVYQFDGVERFGVGTRDARFRYSVKQYFESSVDAKEGAFFELAFSAVGDTLTVYANGKRVGEFRDSSIARPGGVAVHATKGKGVFKDVEVMVLDKAVP